MTFISSSFHVKPAACSPDLTPPPTLILVGSLWLFMQKCLAYLMGKHFVLRQDALAKMKVLFAMEMRNRDWRGGWRKTLIFEQTTEASHGLRAHRGSMISVKTVSAEINKHKHTVAFSHNSQRKEGTSKHKHKQSGSQSVKQRGSHAVKQFGSLAVRQTFRHSDS